MTTIILGTLGMALLFGVVGLFFRLIDWIFPKENPTTAYKPGERFKIPSNYRVYNQGGLWGQNITIESNGILSRHTGHWAPVPRVGDLLLVRLQSGHEGVFVFQTITRARDPLNMFAATSTYIGYREDNPAIDFQGVRAISR